MEEIGEQKYLEVYLDQQLGSSKNVDNVYEKARAVSIAEIL